MRWSKPLFPLAMSQTVKHPRVKADAWRKIRKDTLRKYRYCVFCGGSYDSLICAVFRHPKTVSCCDLCYAVQHLTYDSNGPLVLVRSKLKQHVVVRRFVEFYERNSRSPTVLEIDPEARRVDMSLSEYLRSPMKTDLKLFPTIYFSTEYLKSRDVNMFIDENSDSALSDSDDLLSDMSKQETRDYFVALQRDDPLKDVPKGELTETERTHLHRVFDSDTMTENRIRQIVVSSYEEINRSQMLDDLYSDLIMRYRQEP